MTGDNRAQTYSGDVLRSPTGRDEPVYAGLQLHVNEERPAWTVFALDEAVEDGTAYEGVWIAAKDEWVLNLDAEGVR